MEEEVTLENYKLVGIDDLAMDRNRFGTLVFERAAQFLKKLQELFSELEDLGYMSLLTPNEIADIENGRNRFIEYLNRLRVFDIKQPDASGQHDQLEQEIENFYNDIARQLRPPLTALRQDVALKSQDQKSIQKEARQTQQARKKSEELMKQLEAELKRLAEREKSVDSKAGEVAAAIFGKHFESQAKEYEKRAEYWGKRRDTIFKWLLGIIIANFVVYFCLFITFKTHLWPNIQPSEFFTSEYGIVKLALLIIISYALISASKNYNINSHLEATNKHRKNVAETLKDFLNSKPETDDRSAIVRSGSEAMFKNGSSGYLTKNEESILDVISSVIKR